MLGVVPARLRTLTGYAQPRRKSRAKGKGLAFARPFCHRPGRRLEEVQVELAVDLVLVDEVDEATGAGVRRPVRPDRDRHTRDVLQVQGADGGSDVVREPVAVDHPKEL